ncbi:putative solute:sodium symporter small subunit [Allochromatium warmingii]|uniref:Putative solute:sodium symporter small subunit n=1 Tax=Allochromatium warmingii TaxID=61595 RepID=A0A1H3AST6_ALLWA|nr:sodium/substrate symporter small subunit [Allochromatium warmingii]SDX32703.1 putative solute:sodium symporter small subunit [Allochromatium warmingii]
MTPEKRADYWRAHLNLLTLLLFIGFGASYGCGILLVEPLNALEFGGYRLGFWFAQQGSLFVFVVLVFVYAVLMQRLDRVYHATDADDAA